MNAFLQKCTKQKTIFAHLVLAEIENMQQRYEQLETKHKELQHYSNKHRQLMMSEIKRLKAVNKKLNNYV